MFSQNSCTAIIYQDVDLLAETIASGYETFIDTLLNYINSIVISQHISSDKRVCIYDAWGIVGAVIFTGTTICVN